ncbi:MAG TPA: VWA domain-containing protein [Thermoanaerobaculia bacterium]
MNRILASIAALALAAPVLAQKQVDPELPKLTETIDVRVINVDVVVTDRRGNPVTGLTRDDFEVLENGVVKPITNFYEVSGSKAKNFVAEVSGGSGTAPAAETAPPPEVSESLKRRIIFYVDNLSLAPFNRNRVFTQMKQFVKESMRPGDEAMIATYNRSMKVRVPFTRDVNQINSMLDQIAGESGLGVAVQSERRQIEERIRDAQGYGDAMAAARSYAASIEHDLRQSVASLNALMTTLAGVEGKKILVLTSEGFPMQPGREAFYMVDEIGKEKGWSNVGATMLEPMQYDGATQIQAIARTANANGITLYTIHAGGLGAGNEMSAERQQPVSYAVSNAAITNTTESLQLMAQMTGGVASVQTNNFADAFKKIQRDLDSYYSLGYRAGTERVDRQRYLQVRMKNKEYRARARQSFVEKSVYAEMSDRVVANLLYAQKENDLKILARVGSPRPVEDGLFRVPVDIQIPMESLTLIPQGETDYAGGFDVYVVVGNKDNDMSDVARKTHQLHVPASQIGDIKGKFYTYTLDLLMERGLNKISIGVVDSVSNVTGFRREQIIAQNQ